MRPWFIIFAASLCTVCPAEKMSLVRETRYRGMADASAGVAVSSNLFAVADDEENVLRVYRRAEGGTPVSELDCNAFLQVEGNNPESDLEACARIGQRIYWLGSHGRNKHGKPSPNRRRFFATDLVMTNGQPALIPSGKPCQRLLADLLADARYAKLGLAEAAERPPKAAEGLNLEGMAATPEGHLLLGFRNPIPEAKALLAPLLNPNEVIEGGAARFGEPLLLDLKGLGIRDLVFCDGSYLLIAGSWHGGGPFQLYRWKGGQSKPKPIKIKHLDDYNPEAIITYPDKGVKEFQILSDDGNVEIGGVPGKEVRDATNKTFRSVWVVTGEK
jgi:hypothetical protein